MVISILRFDTFIYSAKQLKFVFWYIWYLEKKVFSLYLCIVRTPQFDIIFPEKKCVLYMGKNGI